MGIRPSMKERPSAQAVECFAHGVAHLISELGHEQGLAKAGQALLDLVEGPEAEEFGADDRKPAVPAVSRR